ncbi:MAG TPA: Stp1/IreP family PP2C-type Ser/Thr phosphatase, partial [Planctomycetota bacterium]|nr:Stp1/IreP family PP2C-type Ser/Thr phosphatase [Planctomycetota bacterium]
MYLEMVGKTDIGRQRSRNEDHYLILDSVHLTAVADGMGGHIDGDVASGIAINTVQQRYETEYLQLSEESSYDDLLKFQERFLSDTILEANKKIFIENKESSSFDGMGTTIVAIIFTNKHAIIAWVGDSRIYLYRKEKLVQITQDHSLISELMRFNVFVEKELLFLQNKNIITRALGMNEDVTVDTKIQEIFLNDIFLLCSDGLTDQVQDSQIEEILSENEDNLAEAARKLIDYANFHGGQDNITVTLAKIKQEISESSKETSKIIQETSESSKETSKIIQNTNESSIEISESSKEINETSKKISEADKETSKIIKETNESSKKSNEAHEEINETSKKISEADKETSKIIKETNESSKKSNEAHEEINETSKK